MKIDKEVILLSTVNGMRMIIASALCGFTFGGFVVAGAYTLSKWIGPQQTVVVESDNGRTTEKTTTMTWQCDDRNARSRTRVQMRPNELPKVTPIKLPDAADEKPALDLTDEQRKQLEDYVKMMHEVLEKEGKANQPRHTAEGVTEA